MDMHYANFFFPQSTLAEGELTFKYRKLNSIHVAQFGGQFFVLCLFQHGKASHQFQTQDIASPSDGEPLISVSIIGPDIVASSCLARINLCEGDGGINLAVDYMPQPRLHLDNAVGNPHFKTQADRQTISPVGSTFVQ